jgi:hypothetical protein
MDLILGYAEYTIKGLMTRFKSTAGEAVGRRVPLFRVIPFKELQLPSSSEVSLRLPLSEDTFRRKI